MELFERLNSFEKLIGDNEFAVGGHVIYDNFVLYKFLKSTSQVNYPRLAQMYKRVGQVQSKSNSIRPRESSFR